MLQFSWYFCTIRWVTLGLSVFQGAIWSLALDIKIHLQLLVWYIDYTVQFINTFLNINTMTNISQAWNYLLFIKNCCFIYWNCIWLYSNYLRNIPCSFKGHDLIVSNCTSDLVLSLCQTFKYRSLIKTITKMAV